MQPWHSPHVFVFCCGVSLITYLEAPAYIDAVGALVLAFYVAYLWFTRWRHGKL